MNNKFAAKVVPYALFTSILLSACGKKSECNIPVDHAHKYTKQITNEIQIEKYIYDEHLHVGGYDWNENYVQITEVDKELYKTLKKKKLFYGADNWDYLYYEMANNHDYLEFYYYYTTVETYTTTDSKGNTQTHTRVVTHDGWTKNPHDPENTGKVRLCHHKYYGYRVNMEDNKFKLEKSPLADDIREIITEYPYFGEKDVKIVDEEFRFKKRELPDLRPEDFDTFKQPDLENKELTINGKVLKKTIN